MFDFLIVLFAAISLGTPEDSRELAMLPNGNRTLVPDRLTPHQKASLRELSYLKSNKGLPYICYSTIPNNTHQLKLNDCCHCPPLFPEGDFKRCGFPNIATRRNSELNLNDPEHCSYFTCILDRSKLLNKDNKTIDVMKVYDHLDNWVYKNPLYHKAVEKVKDTCVDKELPMSHACPSKFLAGCIFTTIAFDCPAGWQNKPECTLLKKLLTICGPFVIRSSTFSNTVNS